MTSDIERLIRPELMLVTHEVLYAGLGRRSRFFSNANAATLAKIENNK
jgi:hypothetical protein